MADAQMYWIEDDIKKIQTKTNLYLQSYGESGAFHLSREIIQNAIDECIDENSPGKNIYITYDKDTDILTCEDFGRGFPETDYPMDIFCTKIQSGSKFFRIDGSSSSGEFGLGLTAVNALSEYFSLTTWRDAENYKHTIEFKEGEKVSDTQSNLKKSDKRHGSLIKFKASRKYLGKNTSLPYKEVIDWVEKMTYLLPPDSRVKIKFEVYKGLKLKETYNFKTRSFYDLLSKITTTDKYSNRCEFSGDGSLQEMVRKMVKKAKGDVVQEMEVTKNVHMDIAFRYIPEGNTCYDTYCNYTNTTQGGVHQDVVEQCLCRYLVAKVNATMSDSAKEKTKILWDDVKSGLCCVVNLSTNAQVGFVGNAKQKINSEKLVPVMKDIVNKGLEDFFSNNQSILTDYIKIIKLNAKARIESQKVKTATQKERMDNFKRQEMKNYIPCNNTGRNQFREIDRIVSVS